MKNCRVQTPSPSNGFIQIPKVLFRDPAYSGISAEAKLLYGLLKDRSNLSSSHGDQWIDESGNVFIYFTHNEIMERFNCGRDKASHLMRELEHSGLVERTRQGLCKPYRLVVKSVDQTTENSDSALQKTGLPDAREGGGNKNENNNSECINIDSLTGKGIVDKKNVKKIVKENIRFDVLVEEMDPALLDLVISIMVDAICSKSNSVKIAGEKRELAEVRQRFLCMNEMHIRYINDRIKNETSIIYSIRGYILMHLYEAEEAMDIYYQSRVAHDFRKHS